MDFTQVHEHESVMSWLTGLPGNGDVVVSHAVFLAPAFRGQGRGMRAHRARLARMSELGFKYALCTVRDDNKAERRILTRNGWRRLVEVSQGVALWGRHIS